MREQVAECKAKSPHEASTKRNWKSFVVRIVASVAILALLLFFLPRESLIEALDAFSVELWVSGVACYLCLHLIGVAKWRMLINAAGGGLSFTQSARCYYYGLFGNTFLPSVVGGDIIRAGLAFRLTHSKSAVVMGSIVDRTIDSFGLALVAGIGALLIPMSLDEGSRNIFWGFAAVIVILTAFFTVIIFILPVQKVALKWRRKMVKLRSSARLLLKRPLKVLLALFAVVALQVSQVVMNFSLGKLALMVNASFLTWLFVWPVAKLSAMAPLTQGGIGVREAVQGTLFVPFGISMEKAVAAGLMFQAIIICGNLFGGFLAMILGRISSSSLRSSEFEGESFSWSVNGSLIFGLILFFVSNSLMLASGSGAVDEQWTNWMSWLPGYGVSFAGSIMGLVYGLLFGCCLGWLGSYLISKTSNEKG